MKSARVLLLFAFTLLSSHSVRGEDLTKSEGSVSFTVTDRESTVPERFRLEEHQFSYAISRQEEFFDKFDEYELTFPSPVETKSTKNNTVHCEYFCPNGGGKKNAVVVLHILGGDFDLSRLFCRALADKGVAALFLKMPYYGPRRDPDFPNRMVSDNPRESVEGMTQAVLDIRRASAWLASRPEVDANHLGIFGISLGGITAALASTAEPRLESVCLMLAGGDIAQVGWSSPELRRLRERWIKSGGTKETLNELLKDVDPVTYGENVRERRILMLNASRDEVIPRECTISLWESFGKPDIVWYDAGHYSAMAYIFDGVDRVTTFFQNAEPQRKASDASK